MNDRIKNICKIGQGSDCCKYLVMGSKGFECSKFRPEDKEVIDMNWALNDHVSQGDNCEGVEDINAKTTTP